MAAILAECVFARENLHAKFILYIVEINDEMCYRIIIENCS